MIGDSWQLRKHSLLGHWAAHSAEPPGPWQNGRMRRGGEKRWGCHRVGRAGREPGGGTAELVPTPGEKCIQIRMDRRRHVGGGIKNKTPKKFSGVFFLFLIYYNVILIYFSPSNPLFEINSLSIPFKNKSKDFTGLLVSLLRWLKGLECKI